MIVDAIVDIFRRVLETDDVDAGSDFFEIGGDSLLATRVLSGSRVVHVDGPRSVEGAFTALEAQKLAERAGLAGARVSRRWPCRYLLSWSRS